MTKKNVNPSVVGNRIRTIRQNLGLSMDEFASRIDDKAKSGTISNWETGKNLPNTKRLLRIAEMGEISLDELLYGTLEESIVGIINQAISFDDEGTEDISEKKRETLLEIATLYRSYLKDFGDPYSFESGYDETSTTPAVRKERIQNKQNHVINKVYEECKTLNLKSSQKNEIAAVIIKVLNELVFREGMNNETFITEAARSLWSLLLNDLMTIFKDHDNQIDSKVFDDVYQLIRTTAVDVDKLKDKYVDEHGNNQ